MKTIMKKKSKSVKELAKWFFEEDLKNGYLDVFRWKDLNNKNKEEYMIEAKFYFKKEKVSYPKNIKGE